MDPPDDWSALIAGRTKVIIHSAWGRDYATYSTLQQRLYEQVVKHSPGRLPLTSMCECTSSPERQSRHCRIQRDNRVAQLTRYMDLIGTPRELGGGRGATPLQMRFPSRLKSRRRLTRCYVRVRYAASHIPRYKGKGDPFKRWTVTFAQSREWIPKIVARQGIQSAYALNPL